MKSTGKAQYIDRPDSKGSRSSSIPSGGTLAWLKANVQPRSFILNVIARRHSYIDHADQTLLRCRNALFNRCLETRKFGYRPETDGTLHACHTGNVDVGIV
jgi:hypothetical protein